LDEPKNENKEQYVMTYETLLEKLSELRPIYDTVNEIFNKFSPTMLEVEKNISEQLEQQLNSLGKKQLAAFEPLVDSWRETSEKIMNKVLQLPVPENLVNQIYDLLNEIDKDYDEIYDLHEATKAVESNQPTKQQIDWNIVIQLITFIISLIIQMQIEAQNDKQHEELIQKLDEIRITIEQQIDEANEADKK